MLAAKSKYFKPWMRFLLLTLLLAYCLIAFLPIPKEIEIGLDPSWQYALTRASEDQLIFGRDIVFSYGPLGYLIVGTGLNQNFLPIVIFRFFISFLFFILAYIRILKLPTSLAKISFISSLAVALIFSRFSIKQDQQILFIFIIILSFYNGKLIRYWGLTLGIIAGFCLSFKINTGVIVLGSSFLLLFDNIYLALKNKSNIALISFLIADSFLATISVLFITLDNNDIASISKLIICLIGSTIIGVSSFWLNKQIIRGKALAKVGAIINSNNILQRIFQPRIIGWSGFYFAYTFGFILMIVYFDHPLLDYLRGALEISYGYSSAMSLVGPQTELLVGISEFVLIFALLTLVAKESSVGYALAFAFILWMNFKHGFIRQDGHVLRFLTNTPLLVSLCIPKLRTFRAVKFSVLIHIYVLSIMVIYGLTSQPFGNKLFPQGTQQIEVLAPAQVAANASTLINLSKLKDSLNQKSYANLSTVKLPDSVINVVKDQEIDIIPSEISLVAANKLNWKPRPIFQSYGAYTPFLDNLNRENLSKNPREYILYKFDSIDGRYPLFDEPETFFYVFCNYQVATQIPDFINLPGISKLILLRKINASQCSPGQPGEKISLPWNTAHKIEVGDGEVVRANIHFKYSLFGKIYNTLFRTPPINIFVTDMNGVERKYRILQTNAQNGIIISHLPANDDEMLLFLKGSLPFPIKSFRFSTSNNLLYKPEIDISFTSYNVGKLNRIGSKNFANNLTSVNDPTKLYGYFEGQSITKNTLYVQQNTIIQAYGWAILPESSELPKMVLLSYGNQKRFFASAAVNLPSPDVVKAFNSSRYNKSRWAVKFSAKSLPIGETIIKAWVYDEQKKKVFKLMGELKVVVEKDLKDG